MKKLSIEDILSKKNLFNKVEEFNVYCKKFDGELTAIIPQDDILIQALDYMPATTNTKMSDLLTAFDYLIYSSIDLLKDTTLRKEFECVEPTEIVSKIFTVNERMNIGADILEKSGFDNFGDEVKKQ